MNVASPLHYLHQLPSLIVNTTYSRSRSIGTGEQAEKKARRAALCPGQFDVDPKTGFFPPKSLPRLPAQFQHWEAAFDAGRNTLTLGVDQSEEALARRTKGEQWRNTVKSWPVSDISILVQDLRLLQRAHMVLASVMHFYVHSMPPTAEELPILVPKPIAVPLNEVSQELRMAPVLTFADTVLWNWELIDPASPLSLNNMQYINVFSGTETERNFYLSSAAVELKGVEMLQIFEGFMSLPDVIDAYAVTKISRDLIRLAKIINELTEIFRSMRETVDPHEFYWMVRPWWSGATSKGPSHPGWIFEGVPNSSTFDLSGASAGQSSVMHALDIFLDIDHKLQEKRSPAPSASNQRADRGFMERMRRYMPGKHRDYLENLASVREVVERMPSLKDSYNAAVLALKNLRDFHIRIVTIYVVTKADSTPPPQLRAGSMETSLRRDGPARGTGGSEVSNLLKAGRDATRRALL
ncbi:hypothetical protein AcV5_006357 [Taiwanofungus camphoratus]|nr:hypothetical protein AcW2_004796 [Antrodia cinnamomea]KAI0934550.1 hypothetical protein AcV5_006357 [Antrodia cinnamomea]KAI0950162.1 hypothetical protein AcV7_008713 [Antrodia cinnamomea]